MKKTLLFFLAFLMAFFPVFANGQKEEASSKPVKKTLIHFYDWAPTDQSIIDDFNRENPDIEVQFHSIPDNGGEKLVQLDILAMGGGDIDVMPGSDGEQMVRMKNGIYAPLDEFIKRDGIDMKASFGSILNYATYNNVTYGYPFRSTVEGIWYNKDMFDAMGIPYPDGTWTWDEYKEIAGKLTHGEGANKVYGTYTHTFNGQWAPVGNEKESWYAENGLSNINSASFKTQLERRNTLDTLGYQLSFNQIKATKATQASYFLGGKCAMVQAGSWLVQNIKDQGNYPHSFRIGIAPLPRFDESIESSNNFSVAASILAIPANSEHKEEAWRFIRYMVEKGALRIAGTGNYPCYIPAYDDELISTFIKGSGLEINDIRPLFGEMSAVSQKPTGAAAAEYQQSMQEQTPLFFNGEKSAEAVLQQIQTITDAAIAKEKSGK
ncbi:sugar ABC transporter substrate-binding protein [uncultured Sphaerochaeta sp.]|uniref:ABC transporter substrate-binding protein n=1 Tax=uncultured Sphaerochaeta sp. TaxID=886478 RepID=UPI002A0A3D33|nr:sugar ABC transporter substrate-binding protein [uncultured Sphaerochaeta sp.]